MKFSRILAVSMALTMFWATASFAAITIKIAHPNVPTHPMGQGYELFKKDLEKRSNGAFKVTIYDSSKYGNADAVIQGLQMGVLQMGSDSTGNFSVFNPKLMLFDMPFIIPDYASSDKITDGPLGESLLNALEKNNCLGLGYIEIGFRNIFSTKPIRTLEDAKHLKIRATSAKTHLAILRALDMNPTPVAWGECYTALQQKTVDAIDVDLNLAYFNKFHEIAPYLTMYNSFYSPHLVVVSKTFWKKLDKQQQKWIQESFAVMQKFERETIRKNEEMIKAEIKKAGGEVIELSPAELKRWIEATKNIPSDFADVISPADVQKMRDTVK